MFEAHLKEHQRQEKRSFRSPKKSRIVVYLLMIVLVVSFVGLGAYYLAHDLQSHLAAGRADLSAAEQLAGGLQIDEMQTKLEAAQIEFAAANFDLKLFYPARWLPGIGSKVAAADDLVGSGLSVLTALHDVFLVARDASKVIGDDGGLTNMVISLVAHDSKISFNDLSVEKKQELLAALAESAPRLVTAVAKIEQAVATFDRVKKQINDPELLAAVEKASSTLQAARGKLQLLATIAGSLPTLFGYPNEKRYLVFFENNTELRPTGGFLGVFSLAKVKNAELTSFSAEDVYALDGPSESSDRPSSPAPIAKYIGVKKWYLRDANWSPDFPTSAAVMERFYYDEARAAGRETQPLDGVVVLTPQLASDLLRLVGPITIGSKTFTADNLVDELEFAVEVGYKQQGIPFFARKSVVSDLMGTLVSRLSTMSLTQLLAVWRVVEKNLAESQILFWPSDQKLQALVNEYDWAGALQPVRCDYVSVIDANMASLKTDRVMQRSIKYTIVPVGDSFEANVAITYHHDGGFDWKTTRYRTYTRVYVPIGAELIAVDGAMRDDKLKDPGRHLGVADVYSELGRTAFGAFISIEPGETRTLTFRYRLPSSVVTAIHAGTYNLYFEKQPGLVATGLTLDLDFGKNLTKARPAEQPTEFGDAHYKYSTDLRTDRQFAVGL